MADELRDLAQTIFPQPVTQGERSQAFVGVFGEALDAQTVLDKQALKARYTDGVVMGEVADSLGVVRLPTTGDTERLRRLGAAKGVQRYSTESDTQFEARIDSAIGDAKLLSTAAAIKRQIRAYGIPDVEVYEEWEYRLFPARKLVADPQTPMYDPEAPFVAPLSWEQCSAAVKESPAPYLFGFTVVCGPDFGALGWSPLMPPFQLGAVALGIAGATEAQFFDLVRIIQANKSASSFPVRLVCRFGEAPLLGLVTLPFVLGGSSGSGVATRGIGEQRLLGTQELPFVLNGDFFSNQ